MERIQHFLIHSTLGEGSFGVTYEAVDLENAERRVALKILQQTLAAFDDVRKRFEEEMRALGKLEHPGIPKLLFVGPHELTFLWAEEPVPGPTLESTLKPGGVPIEEAIKTVESILEILSYAHQKEITHRNLKSSNVILTASGAVKILNLGIRKIVEGADEVAAVRADLYSAGAILHELLTGSLPVVALPGALTEPPSLDSLRADVPPSLLQFYRRCTANDPAERWTDAASALAALRNVRPNAPPPPEAIVEVDGLRIRVEPFFDHAAYASDDDPRARFLLELEVRRSKTAAPEAKSAVCADIVLVLDVSGSMETSDRYPLLRRAVDQLLDRIDEDDRVGIVLFALRADVISPLISGSEARDQAAQLLSKMDRSGIKFGGATNLGPGLQAALHQLRRAAPRVECVPRIYVLTDGELHDAHVCERHLEEMRRGRVEMHVYGFGSAFDAAALKRMVSDQLGGSVKPICNEEDIVATFSHIADVNRRLVMREGILRVEFAEGVECGDAWSFRPQERWLGPIGDRRLIRELGGVEDKRVYALFAEVRLPPAKDQARTPVARATLSWRDGETQKTSTALIDVARASADDGPPLPRVEQAFAILDALRKRGDRDAELRAAEARLELAQIEGRDPGLISALQKQIAVLQGRVEPSAVSDEDKQYLDADLSTNAGLVGEDELQAYLASEARTADSDKDDGGVRVSDVD